MSILVVLQSRLSSSRLPGKALLDVAGAPLVVTAAKRAGNRGARVVVATSTEPADDTMVDSLRYYGVAYRRGPLNDTLARFAQVCDAERLADDDVVVRLTGDNLVPDGEFVQELVTDMGDRGEEYIRVDPEHMPYGLGAEAFTARMLMHAASHAQAPFDREHVTPWIRRHTNDAEFVPTHPDDSLLHTALRCTVDTLDDYVVACAALKWLSAQGGDTAASSWRDLLVAFNECGGRRRMPPAAPDNPLKQGGWVLGTVQLGVPYGAASGRMPADEEASAILASAASLGVTHLDTARAYGQSEARIGRALAHGLSEKVRVVTKIRPLTDVPLDAEPMWAREAVNASIATSMGTLRVSAVDAVLTHRAVDWLRGNGAVADTLDDLVRDNRAKSVGVSLATPAELIDVLADGRVTYIQLPFNLLDRRWLADDVREALATRRDVIITVRSVFLQGLLANPESARWPVSVPDDATALRAALTRLRTELGRESTADLAMAYVRAHPFVTSVVLGADSHQQVREQADLFNTPALSPDEVERVHAEIPAGSDQLTDPSTWS